MIEFSTKATIKVDCEACGKHFEYPRMIKAQGYDAANAAASFAETINKREFGSKRCPGCGYVQSWMAKTWQNWWTRMGAVLGLLAGTALLIGATTTGYLLPERYRWIAGIGLLSPIIGPAIGALLGHKLAKPNKRYIAAHGGPAAPREPNADYKKPSFLDHLVS